MNPEHIPDMEFRLKALANRNRLFLLSLLEAPHRVGDIVVRAAQASAWGGAARPLTRQTIQSHLDRLVEIEAVMRLDAADGATYSVRPSTLFEITQQLQELAAIRPQAPVPEETVPMDGAARARARSEPHLVVVRGLAEGGTFPLGAGEDAFAIGRGRDNDLCLEHDRHVSTQHASIHKAGGEHILVDSRNNRNGTRLNFQPLPRGGMVPLTTGDLIEIGRSMFLYRDA